MMMTMVIVMAMNIINNYNNYNTMKNAIVNIYFDIDNKIDI